ncbi:hypothetical protein M758_10G051000 [Ceratodon purpureus]|nr:hypothetical protein M758_10G051000 [Ceratodon purpureus]
MDYVNNSIHSIRNLRSWVHFITQFPPSVIEHKRRNNSQLLNLLEQLWGTENLLSHLSSPTLKTYRVLLRELDDVIGRAIALVKEVYLCSELPREHYSGEHYLEVFLELRWWTWMVICVVADGFIRTTFGREYFVIPKGILDPASSRLPSFLQKLHLWCSGSDGYARHLPSYGIEAFLRKAEGLSTLSVWLKTTSGRLLNESDVDTEYIIEGKALVPVLGAYKPPRVRERKVDLTQVILGVSHSALVIKCEDSGKEYALKRVNGLDLKQPILAHLFHPHVVRLLDFWRENGFLFLAMELMEGDLAELIARRLKESKMPFTMDVAVDFMLQIAKTMLYLHDLGLTHPHLQSSDVLFKEAKDKSSLGKNESHYLLKLGDFRFYAKNDFKSVAQQNVYQFGLICVEVLSNEPLHWTFEERILGMSQKPKVCFDALRNGSQSSIPGLLTECIGKCLNGTTQFSEVVVMLLLSQLQVLTKAAEEPSGGEHLPLAKQQDVSSRPGSSSRFPIIPEGDWQADGLPLSEERRAMVGTSGCSRQLGRLKLSDTSCATSGSNESGNIKAPPSEAHPVSASWSFLSARSESLMSEQEEISVVNSAGISEVKRRIKRRTKRRSIAAERRIKRSKTHWSTPKCSKTHWSTPKRSKPHWSTSKAWSNFISYEADHTSPTTSGYISAMEVQIERSKAHWSTLPCMGEEEGEGDCEAEESNVLEFMHLQRHPTFGGFFCTFGYELGIQKSQGELVVGEKFAEGGQAELFHAKVTWWDPKVNEKDEREGKQFVVKVFKKGTFLRDVKSQWPHGWLQFHVDEMENYWSPTPKVTPRQCCEAFRCILLKNGQFAFLMEKFDFDLWSLIERKMELRSYGDSGPFSKEDGEVMMYDIALGVEWLHNCNIIHRDVTASNVLVKEFKSAWPKWRCFVADYECSIGIVGTGFFRAPEILQACKERMAHRRPEVFSRAADVYAYGMTCYEVLTGKLPFDDHPLSGNWLLLHDLVINQGLRPEVPEYVEGWARDLLKWCWQSDPSARPTIEEVLDLMSRNSASTRRLEKLVDGENFRDISKLKSENRS